MHFINNWHSKFTRILSKSHLLCLPIFPLPTSPQNRCGFSSLCSCSRPSHGRCWALEPLPSSPSPRVWKQYVDNFSSDSPLYGFIWDIIVDQLSAAIRTCLSPLHTAQMRQWLQRVNYGSACLNFPGCVVHQEVLKGGLFRCWGTNHWNGSNTSRRLHGSHLPL